MYRTIGAVNGPGWRPKPDRPVLETSVCLMGQNEETGKVISKMDNLHGLRSQSRRKDRPSKLSPIMSPNGANI